MKTPLHIARPPATAWYREPWPWVLLGLPLTAVLAGVATLLIAIRHDDGLVAEDYYKQGLTINQRLEREQRAASLGLQARVSFGERRAVVQLTGAAPAGLRLRFVHPTRVDLDRELPAARVGAGVYETALPDMAAVRWQVQIEDFERTWRLSGEWPGGTQLVLSSTSGQRGTP